MSYLAPFLNIPFIGSFLGKIVSVIESVIIFVILLFAPGDVTGANISPQKYLDSLNNSGIFANTTKASLPQTTVYDLVLAHFAETPSTQKPIKKVAFIGYDGGMAAGILLTKNSKTSGVQLLNQTGGIYNAYAGGKFPYYNNCVSAQGWGAMLTGHWSNTKDGTGVNGNDVPKEMGKPETFLTTLGREGKKVASFVNWSGFFRGSNATYLYEVQEWAEKGYPITESTTGDDATVTSQAIAAVRGAACPDVLFVALNDADNAGHTTSFGLHNPNYAEAFLSCDTRAFNIITAIQSRSTYANEDWLFIISSDHGGTQNYHDPNFTQNRQIFIATNKPIAN